MPLPLNVVILFWLALLLFEFKLILEPVLLFEPLFDVELLFIKLFMVELVFEEDDPLDESVDETACPVTKPCKISAKFFALAYFKRKTFKPPKRSADGTSNISIIWRIRLRDAVSPLITIRLVRLSAIIRTRAPFKSLAAPVELIESNKPIISSA